MKQFLKVFRFELNSTLLNKKYLGITLFLMILIIVIMYIPNIMNALSDDNSSNEGSTEVAGEASETSESNLILVGGEGVDLEGVSVAVMASFPDAQIEQTDLSEERIKEKIKSKEVKSAVFFSGPDECTYILENIEMYEDASGYLSMALDNFFRREALVDMGIDSSRVEEILSKNISVNIETLGVNRMENFFYTYIMIFALYMCIVLYGNMISTSVAVEKSSRAMELLVTSIKPQSMMFGKVFASCLAGFVQLVLVFGTAVLTFQLNGKSWGENHIIESIFNMPISLFVYLLVFFVLGFILYGFLLGAVGSTVSKMEELNMAVMPVTYLFIIAFCVVMFSMSSGKIDTLLMKVCSFIPFTSPMAMFARIAMGEVPFMEIALSLVILAVSVIVIAILAAKIYRVGVLLYGVKPGVKTLIKALKNA